MTEFILRALKGKTTEFDVNKLPENGRMDLVCRCVSNALFISNDTGPMHIAAAQGINCIGIFGPNTPIKYGPYSKNSNFTYKGLSCSPCIGIKNNCFFYCRKQECVKTIDVDDIIQKTVSLLNL